ncbi:ashwin [Bombina bombina]|uniref:ashwin n=1 Tax=Bombina bombina TaxID=8345 RepID=UPI00235B22F7|nr:ashwin [Bombina bombina]
MAKLMSSGTDPSLLLHPELLSQDFLRLSLQQKNIIVEDALNDKEKLTEMFVQHALPLPQRSLPKNRWGKLIEGKRGDHKPPTPPNKCASSENVRKRPLIVFDGSSTNTSIKLKKKENGETFERLHPPPTDSTNNTHRKIVCPTNVNKDGRLAVAGNHGHHATESAMDKNHLSAKSNQPILGNVVKIKRAAPKEESNTLNDLSQPSEAKKKIQHVTWP